MDFGLSEAQRALQQAVLRFLDRASSPDKVRKAANGERAVREEIRRGLNRLGVTGLVVPESFGGLGLTVLDAALTQEALGRNAAPADILSDTMAIVGIEQAGTQLQKQRWFADVLSAEVRFGVALSHRTGARDGAGVRVEGGRLDGKALFALGTDAATHFMVADDYGGLWIVDRDAPGLGVIALITIDPTRSVGELRIERVQAEPLSSGADMAAVVDRMIAVGRTLLAADTLGAAQRMLEQAVAYSMERRQFDRVIGSFQAVKHLCAEMAAEIEPSRSLVWYAAYAADARPGEVSLMACHAKAHLAEVGQFVARTATEVHGGIGFTDELGLHHWFKRIGLNRQLLGGPERLRWEAGRLQGWAQA